MILNFDGIILHQQPTASRLLHHMIVKLLDLHESYQHEVFIRPKSECSSLIRFRKKRISHQTTHTSPESLPAAIAPSSVKTTSNQG